MEPVQPIFTTHLFPGLNFELIRVLRGLPEAAWEAPTVCAGWAVRDVSAHLLGGTVNRLAHGRDGKPPSPRFAAVRDYTELVAAINEQNHEYVREARLLSVPDLVSLLNTTDSELYAYFASLPPFETSGPAVAWAGDEHSPNWFDIAREYTEKWLHQQHIREAVGAPVLAERHWLFPVLDTFMRALPHTYRDVAAANGAALAFQITGAAGGAWSLLREDSQWRLHVGLAQQPLAVVRLDQDVAWRLFTKGLSAEAAAERVTVEGDVAVGGLLLTMTAIMA